MLWVSVIAAYIWMVLTMSMSGHTSWISSIGIIPAFGYGCYKFFGFSRKGILERLLGAVAFALLALILIKNLTDYVLPWNWLFNR